MAMSDPTIFPTFVWLCGMASLLLPQDNKKITNQKIRQKRVWRIKMILLHNFACVQVNVCKQCVCLVHKITILKTNRTNILKCYLTCTAVMWVCKQTRMQMHPLTSGLS